LDDLRTVPQINADRRDMLFVFPSPSPESVATSAASQEPSELRATALLFGMVLVIPTLLGLVLLAFR
jgi:hypothetical protein